MAERRPLVIVGGQFVELPSGDSLPGTGGGGNPTGTVIWFAGSTPPTGYLKANGAAVSRTTYADLFSAIGTTYGAGDGSTTFLLPDLRGRFARSLDDGAGRDSGRGLGTTQTDSNRSHAHTGSTASGGGHSHTVPFAVITTGANTNGSRQLVESTGSTTSTSTAADHTHTVTINSDGGTESRPINIALLACIKY